MYKAVPTESWKTKAKRNLYTQVIHMDDERKMCKLSENIPFNCGSCKQH